MRGLAVRRRAIGVVEVSSVDAWRCSGARGWRSGCTVQLRRLLAGRPPTRSGRPSGTRGLTRGTRHDWRSVGSCWLAALTGLRMFDPHQIGMAAVAGFVAGSTGLAWLSSSGSSEWLWRGPLLPSS